MDARSTEGSLQPEYGYPAQSDYDQVSESRPGIGVADIVDALRRGWRLPVVGLMVGLVIGLGLFMSVKAPYRSTARILIDRSMNRYLQNNKIIDQPTLDDTEIGGQMYLLSSDSVILPVVRAMKLAQDGDFAGRMARGEPDAAAERAAVENVLKRLTVNREDVANVISVTFESGNANQAADIANAIAENYIDASAQQKLKSTKRVSEWLQERLAELKTKSAEADHALQAYREANHLPNTGTGLQSTEHLADLKVQLENARIAVAEAKQRYERIRQSPEDITSTMAADALVNTSRQGMISFALSNTDLVKLRAQYRELAAKAAEIEARVGSKHTAFIKVNQQVEAARSAVRSEEERLIDAYANEYEIAKTREKELAATIAGVSGEGDSSGQLRELESTAETLRNLYNGYLQKYKEINSAQSETVPVQNAHIISKALPQLYKSRKKPLMLFGGSLALCLFLGAGVALGREWLADVFRNARAVEQVTGMYCVVLPLVETNAACIEEHVLAAPYSRFAESLRNIRATIDAAPSLDGAKVIGVVSSAPKEGKTVVAANLGALTTLSSGKRTLVIDSDLHLRRLTDALASDAREGLIEALENPSRLSSLVVRRQRSGLDILPCVVPDRIPNAAELLGSAKMERLLAAARQHYDYIIIEIAPIMSVVDVKMVERFVDGFLFVTEWGRTRRALVVDALTEAQAIRDRVYGVVLNKVDAIAMRMIEARKGLITGDYYQG